MEGKLPEEQVKSLLAPWRFSLQSSGFENRLVTALELYEHFPLDIVVTGGTRDANVHLANAVCATSDEKVEEEEEEDEEETGDKEEEVEKDDKSKDKVSKKVSIVTKEDEKDEEGKLIKEKKKQARSVHYANVDSVEEGPLLLHPKIPNVRIWTVEGGPSSIQISYDVLVILTTEIHHEDHIRFTMEQREKDKPLYLVRADQEWDLVSEKPDGPCKTCAWERMRARNLELQKKHKLASESGHHAKEGEMSSEFPSVAKLLGLKEIAEVLIEALPELRKTAFSQFLVDITRETRVSKAPNMSTTPLVCSALKSGKISQEDLDRISTVFHPRDLTDQPSKLLSVLNALEHFRLDIGLLGETGCGSSSLFNSLLGLEDSDQGAVSIGVTETTQEPVSYPYPGCTNAFVWDLPGLGRVGDLRNQSVGFGLHQTPLLPSDLPACDVYILVSPLRLGLGYIRLLQHLLSQGKSCYLVISKADLIEEKSAGEVRRWTEEALEKLGLKQDVFLVSALHPETMDYDELKETLGNAISMHKRATLASYVAKLLDQDVFWKRADPCKLM
uniref:Zmp:0000000951 n=1 Tax=Astyanax mexicanus TaxID=7994 RepID=A0A8B9HRC8_ASTMX